MPTLCRTRECVPPGMWTKCPNGEVVGVYRPLHTSDTGPVPADGSPRPELANALAGARRRAQRDGDGQADTAHLLHALLEHDPASREAVDACEQGGEQLVKLLGLLVQRNIGYGLKWHGSVEDSGAVPMARSDGWSPAAAEALEAARKRADGRGDRRRAPICWPASSPTRSAGPSRSWSGPGSTGNCCAAASTPSRCPRRRTRSRASANRPVRSTCRRCAGNSARRRTARARDGKECHGVTPLMSAVMMCPCQPPPLPPHPRPTPL